MLLQFSQTNKSYNIYEVSTERNNEGLHVDITILNKYTTKYSGRSAGKVTSTYVVRASTNHLI